MKKVTRQDVAVIQYVLVMMIMVTVWLSIKSLHAFTIGEVYKGKVTGNIHVSEETGDELIYSVGVTQSADVLANFEGPLVIGQEVYVFCTDLQTKVGSECSGYTFRISSLQILFHKLQAIPLMLILAYLLNYYRKRTRKQLSVQCKTST